MSTGWFFRRNTNDIPPFPSSLEHPCTTSDTIFEFKSMHYANRQKHPSLSLSRQWQENAFTVDREQTHPVHCFSSYSYVSFMLLDVCTRDKWKLVFETRVARNWPFVMNLMGLIGKTSHFIFSRRPLEKHYSVKGTFWPYPIAVHGIGIFLSGLRNVAIAGRAA